MPNTNFTHHFLVAMPSLQGTDFERAVIYLCEHDENGAMGLMINKPMDLKLGNILRHLEIKVGTEDAEHHPVLMGGPVGQEHGFIIHPENFFQPLTDIAVSSSKKMLESIAEGSGPADFIITLGYSGWESGQLEEELNDNDWLIVPFDRNVLFNIPLEHRWQEAALLAGINIHQLSGHVGHA
ncbi:MAG TPA: YqgE/AlgH family protein [Coxiellaceae bacterium]|nr:YqgE/AlgH family protein [Coxiellaceae bacterium]